MKYYTTDIHFLLASATGAMFCDWAGAGTYLICKWCCSSIFTVNYNKWMLIIILNLTLTRCFYEKTDEKKQALYDYNHFQSGWVLDYRLDAPPQPQKIVPLADASKNSISAEFHIMTA